MRDRYANVTDPELSEQVSDLQAQFPNCGVEVITTYENNNMCLDIQM